MLLRLTPLAVVVCLAGPQLAMAQDCPTEIPSNSRDRRALAKDWFGRAEAAETANSPIAAVKAYQCSLRIVPHAFTAFNLGRLAERTGDLEMALEAFNTYLQLAPEAQDRPDIEARIAALNVRIAALRQDPGGATAGNTGNNTGTVTPAPGPDVTRSTPSDPLPLPDVRPTTPSETPPGLVETAAARDEGTGRKLHPGVWVASGVGVAALVGGVVLNLSARGKMDDCHQLAGEGQIDAADKACKAARPRAFTSYALFGVTAAAAVADAVFIWMSMQEPESPRMTLNVRPDGASVGAYLRF